MDNKPISVGLRRFSLYYSLLQICHLVLLTRAGAIFLTDGKIPFPAQPPIGGWASQTIPFLLGMGFMDGLAAVLAIYAGWVLITKRMFLDKLWAISLTIAITSAIVYCFGTLPSGAWIRHPLGYGSLGIAFAPLFVYYVYLMKYRTGK
jgi:hypothetical protein